MAAARESHLGTAERPRWGILVLRILVLAAAFSAVVAAVALTRATGGRSAETLVFVCPMHAEVTSPGPADCPICHMALEQRGSARAPGPPAPDAGPGDVGVAATPATLMLPSPPSTADVAAAYGEFVYGQPYETSRAITGPAWAESAQVARALLFRDEIASLDPKEGAVFVASTRAGERRTEIQVERMDAPPMDWDAATAFVRVRVTSGQPLMAGTTGSIQFAAKLRAFRGVPASAIVHAASGPYVFLLDKVKGTLTRRPILVGGVFYDRAGVLSGLVPGERIATAKTFQLDAERRFLEEAPR